MFLKPGATKKGYWKNADLIDQIRGKSFPIFWFLHLDCDGIFMVDYSNNHQAKQPDALIVSVVNVCNGGSNQRRMRNGWYAHSGDNHIEQEMVLEDKDSSKSLKPVLQERGICHLSLNVKGGEILLS